MNELAGSGGARTECPHCGVETAAAVECPACGIIFAKYHGREPEPDSEPVDLGIIQRQPAGARITRLIILLALLAISVAMLAYSELRSEPEIPIAPMQARSSTGPTAEPSRPAPGPPESPARSAPAPVQPEATQPPIAQPTPSPARPEPRPRPTTYSYDWYEDARGFAEGLAEAEEDGRAIAVYFHTDWCGYCRELERELLSRAKVESYLRYMTKVKINPERGDAERYIADQYGVTGYPSLFIHPGAGRPPTKVSGMKRRHGDWVMKTTDEFVATIRRVVGDV